MLKNACVCACDVFLCVSRAALDSSVKLDHVNKLWDSMSSLRIREILHLSVFITDLTHTLEGIFTHAYTLLVLHRPKWVAEFEFIYGVINNINDVLHSFPSYEKMPKLSGQFSLYMLPFGQNI